MGAGIHLTIGFFSVSYQYKKEFKPETISYDKNCPKWLLHTEK